MVALQRTLLLATSLVALSTTAFCAACQASQEGKTGDDGMVELMPASRVSRSDAEFIEKNQQVLLSNQHLIEKVLSHLGVPYYEPKLPKYRPLGANTILAVTDQIFYATAARKLGAPLPEASKEQSGSGVDNNKFLHLYNNEILRSIAKKLGLSLPEPVVQSGSQSAFSHQVIVQNHEILTAIAKKLGVKP